MSNRTPHHRLSTVLLIAGLILMTVYAAVTIGGRVSAHLALQKFKTARLDEARNTSGATTSQTIGKVDVSLWSPQRIHDYMESLVGKTDAPLAVMRIPKLHMEVPVFDGTDEVTLNRGAGRIIGTAKLGQPGNIGIAGHRDGFFRELKDIGQGDTIELILPARTERYAVTSILITTPEDVSVLRPTDSASLTLVTCYPFYFIGSAPQRFIVQASVSAAGSSENSFLINPKTK